MKIPKITPRQLKDATDSGEVAFLLTQILRRVRDNLHFEEGAFMATSENWMLTLTPEQAGLLSDVAERGLSPTFTGVASRTSKT
ncbi:MAG: hypothetical protein E6Q97_16725 [Desulfurellales bacterium]|nr:MAG: hypothetical protein E6Q97_16725 [Desulfurellales bacterium]